MSTLAIGSEYIEMDMSIGMGMNMEGEPSLEFLLKPLTASHVRRAFRGRKSLALLHSWDEIVYRNIKRVFKYKEFEKEWAHIASNEQRLMQKVTERRKRHKARALRHKAAASSSSSARRKRSSKKSGAAPIRPLRSGRSHKAPTSTNSKESKTKAKVSSLKANKVTEPKAIKASTSESVDVSPPKTKAAETKFKVIHGCYYFYPSAAEKNEQSIADGYDTLSSSNSVSA